MSTAGGVKQRAIDVEDLDRADQSGEQAAHCAYATDGPFSATFCRYIISIFESALIDLKFILYTITPQSQPHCLKQLSHACIMPGNENPGNFANRPKEEVQDIASKGGQASHQGGFAGMDADKQRDIASQGGQASSGSFEPGSEKAREAGRKGGLSK
jgi:general stress protein YciG